MKIIEGTKFLTINGRPAKAIIEYVIQDYSIFVFQGVYSKYDILIKYSKNQTRIRTPKHIHWAVDALIKMQVKSELTRKFLLGIKKNWETTKPLPDNNFETLKALIENGEQCVDLKQYEDLSNCGEYSVEFLYILMQLLAVQEKTNRSDAYMFGQILDELLKNNMDIFKIVSTAGYNGRHR